MGIRNFSIELNSDQLVYYPSQDIAGVVVIELEEIIEGKDLIVKFIGKSQCRFKGRTGKHGRGDDAHTQIYSSEHIIVEHEKNLSNPAAGKHELEFSFNFPSDMPSSMEAPLGNIRYVLSAHIGDSFIARYITINQIIDTNTEENSIGSTGESSESASCLCVVNGPLDVKASLSRMCYCPGEAILVSVNITNGTNRKMNALTAKLFQTIKYKTKGRTKNISTAIASLKGPKIKKGDSYVWEDQPLGIPAVAPTISNDVVIEVQYHVRVDIGVTFGSNIGVNMPIIIGTVPYLQENAIEKYGTTEDPQTAPLSNVVSGPPPDFSIFGYPGMASPLYSTPLDQGKGRRNVSFECDKDAGSELKYCPIYTFVQPQRLNTEDTEGKDMKAEFTEEVKGNGTQGTEENKGDGTQGIVEEKIQK